MTFKTWMRKFENESSDFGQLAEEVCSNPYFPRTKKLGKIIEYLFEKGERLEFVFMIYESYIKFKVRNEK
jgi:3-methyladenine DNA glycosylase AlkC